MREITSMTALQVAEKIKLRELSVSEVVKAQLEVIKKRDSFYKAYITVMEEDALAQAESVQQRIDNGELSNSPLAGVTIAIKDNICTKGIKTTCGSKMLADYVPAFDATVIEKLKNAGVILIGKTNLDEFAMGDSTKTSYFGQTRNPWNTAYSPGGSSGGSAAAVSAEEAHISIGTDTGGSIRQPASYCGLVGLKPTYGVISRYGLIPMASSLDQIGPITRNIADCAALLEVIAGYDPKDSTSAKIESVSYRDALIDDIKGMKIGIPKLYLEDDLDEDISNCFFDAVKIFEEKGAHIELFDMDGINCSSQVYKVLSCAEVFSNLARYDGVKYGYRTKEYNNLDELYKKSRGESFGYEAKMRIMLGAFVLSKDNYEIYYDKARKIRRLISIAYEKAFEKYDVILSPESLYIVPLLNEKVDYKKKCKSGILNSSVNLAGLPGLSIPCGYDKNGMPIGMQLIGKRFGEKDIIRAAFSYEQERPYERPKTLQ